MVHLPSAGAAVLYRTLRRANIRVCARKPDATRSISCRVFPRSKRSVNVEEHVRLGACRRQVVHTRTHRINKRPYECF